MTPKLKRLFIAVIAIQVVFLLGLVGYRETILTLGRTAVLQTVPIDPRDLFKGEYVTLRYEIGTLGLGGREASQARELIDERPQGLDLANDRLGALLEMLADLAALGGILDR